ncbi:hypothetical protein [Pantoea eucrina]|uniref:hypothetical protein n=1 Tax=Pantoea eucrina TaxID=472693 RepID=UPI00080F55D6|nr:hypothetical protein [Pantoea eucrina]
MINRATTDEELEELSTVTDLIYGVSIADMAKELQAYRKAFSKPAAYTVEGQLRFENELKIGDMWAEPFDESVDVPLYRKPEV